MVDAFWTRAMGAGARADRPAQHSLSDCFGAAVDCALTANDLAEPGSVLANTSSTRDVATTPVVHPQPAPAGGTASACTVRSWCRPSSIRARTRSTATAWTADGDSTTWLSL